MKTVVVSVGTDHHPFDRLLEWASEVQRRLDVHVVAQRGATPPRSDIESFDYEPAADLEARMRAADAVVCHGGPGTIGVSRSAGQRPIVVPRNPSLGEHVDDHQMRYSQKLVGTGEIDVVESCEALIELLGSDRERCEVGRADDVEDPVAEFAALVDALLGGRLATRSLRTRFQFRRTA